MISLQNISKTFKTGQMRVEAVKDVSLDIKKGEVFGIIGFSGAGKSTLVRCINLLERPEKGKVIIDGTEITSLSEKELRQKRQSVGMIFQHFNLMPSRTVGENIAYPLRKSGMAKAEIKERVKELLETVGLEDKENSYPGNLSGGQKQRVAIARAIAPRPKVLLCDEATSALDPATTQSVLELLKRINTETGITMVVITHEMAVVKEICDRVAVMENGVIAETGDVARIFTSPAAPVTRSFVESVTGTHKLAKLLEEGASCVRLKPGQVLARLKYLGSSADKALISEVSRLYNVGCNIIFGNMEIVKGSTIGTLSLIFEGREEDIKAAIWHLSQNGVAVEVIKR